MKLTCIANTLGALALTLPISVCYADDTSPAPAPAANHHKYSKHHAALPAVSANLGGGDKWAGLDKWAGTYSSTQTNFVTVKRLTFTKEKDGTLKIQGVLVGFPDEVPIGEATAEAYADRNSKPNPDTLVASFSSEKYKPLMVITPGQWDGQHFRGVNFTCYMKDVDGSKVHINDYLSREQ